MSCSDAVAAVFILFVVIKVVQLFLRLGKDDSKTSHGSARFATFQDAKEAGNYAPETSPVDGLLLGVSEHRSSLKGFDPRYRVESHVLTCAPTGSVTPSPLKGTVVNHRGGHIPRQQGPLNTTERHGGHRQIQYP
jgi:hypothetical protein